MLSIYRLGIWLYGLVIKLVSPLNGKAREFREGRKGIFPKLANDLKDRKGKLVWVHVASLGEFEQGRPIIEELKQWGPDVQVLITFFSPSGYKVRKEYPLADWVSYMPLDSKSNAFRFISIVQPDLAIFIKYELWYYYLMALHQHKISVLMVSAIFRPDQFYFKSYGKFFRPALDGVNHFFVQNIASGKLLQTIGIGQFTVTGDTRYDRVVAVAEKNEKIAVLKRFKEEEKVMIIGSAWDSDMEFLDPFISKNQDQLKFVIAPHNVKKQEVSRLLELPGSIAFSQANEQNVSDFRILIIDSIGMLSSLYKYGDFAYLGGGFRGTLHNTLEAAVYGMPVLFGQHKNNSKFLEAQGLVKSGGGFEVLHLEELNAVFERLVNDKDAYERVCEAAKTFVYNNTGATSKIMSTVKEFL